MEVLTLSRNLMEKFKGVKDYVVISINDPKRPDAIMPDDKYLKDVARFKFHDIDEPIDDYVCMDIHQAYRMSQFIKEYEDKLIVIHCTAGLSRSAGVAMAIKCWARESHNFPFANRHVYRLVRIELQRR